MKKKLAAVLTALILALIIYTIFFSDVFKIKTIQVAQESCITREQVESTLSLTGKNTILINTEKLTRQLKDKYSCLENIQIKKIYPSTISIQTRSTQPVAKIDETDYLVTEGGLVIEKTQDTQLPKIYIPQGTEIKLNQKITSDKILFGLTLAREVAKTDFTPASVRFLEEGDVAVYSTQEAIALFSTTKSAAGQVDSLQSVLAKAKIDAAKIEKIDLRFDKPTIVYKK